MTCKKNLVKGGVDILPSTKEIIESSTYHSLLQLCLTNRSLAGVKLVHAHMIQTAFQSNDVSLENKLMSSYAKCCCLLDASRVFDKMPERNVVSWSAIIAAYSSSGYGKDTLVLFKKMKTTSIQSSQFIFSSVVTACDRLACLREVHGDIIRSGFESDLFVGNALVCMYTKCGSVEDARHMFDKMSEPNVITWNAMVAGYARNGYVAKALEVFQGMPERNVVSWTSMIAGYVQNGFLKEACQLFDKMPERNVVSWTCMISGYARNGFVDKARELFDKMPERNLVSWVAMIAGYAQNGQIEESLRLFQKMPVRNVVSWNAVISGCVQSGHSVEALKLYRQMQLQGVKLNSTTFSSVLSACADLVAMEQGIEIHEEVVKEGLESDLFVGNALVDMYAKCGSVRVARNMFDKMIKRDVISWNTMIAGYAMHGFGKEALELFDKMQCCGPCPDHVTFVGILSACCHAGLVDEGRKYFNNMSQYYHVMPAMEHYASMVDLLGRAGHLDEAKILISKMQMKPDYIVWSSLLAACRIHNDIKLAECVAERLIELNPLKSTPYVLLSNMYATAGRKEGVDKVRKMMKGRGVSKEPGCSWIEINKRVHAFFSGDKSRTQMHKIYEELDLSSG
ncbi:pentatricopeptide repeat-containing protein At4g02750 [Cryptomeria japonica]|uniref:pentatricopeptide repeat-containing protein At4g02750 n=1 Tax=Cryptomeria japonica TaxID=3369 RepID=UPI0027DA6E40|nr:pentatricopeptide repeat-containing protein At4g02750 [Cryptomeria japonica]XP_057838634.2 pentatricopeptide repeat-containing protein At4g02750 [Cryptomeria japonica]XP_057838641.2 pentatricopeptide repeat-containing protein At4g02750 [Cryptomeria japonica]